MKMPRLTIDRAALKKGFWGNTWKNWGYIFAAFLVLYAAEAGYFTGMLFAAKRIRGHTYMTLPTQYFGKFERENLPVAYAYPDADAQDPFNRPQGCTVNELNLTIAGDTFSKPSGVETCTSNKNYQGWTLFPWVIDTNAAGKFPGCDNANGATVITAETSPAFVGDVVASPDLVASQACQNFVPVAPDNATAAAPGAAPARAPVVG